MKIQRVDHYRWIWLGKELGDNIYGNSEEDCYEKAKAYLHSEIMSHEFLMNQAKQGYRKLVEDNK